MAASLIWTAFTLVNLFWPPLIIVQLLVIWVTFYLIKPPESVAPKPAAGGSFKPPAAATAPPPAPAVARPPLPRVSPPPIAKRTVPAMADKKNIGQPKLHETPGILSSVALFLNELDDRVSFQRAVQTATSPLLLACETERLYIEKSLEDAQRRLERESVLSADDEMQKIYASHQARLEKLLHDGGTVKPPAAIKCTDFRLFPVHADRSINQAIEDKLNAAIDDYGVFLGEVLMRLKNPGLKAIFEQSISDIGGGDLLGRLFCFGRPGADWRGIAEIGLWREFMGETAPRPQAATEISPPGGAFFTNGRRRRISVTARVMPNFPTPPQSADQTLRDAIGKAALGKKIPLLAHFTRASNLKSILAHGLCPIDKARAAGLNPHLNDPLRLDGYPGAVSLSIAFPNYKMFYKYRMLNPGEYWVVLLLDPAILWEKKCGFCRYNAADRRILGRSLATLTTIDAFHDMFTPAQGGPSREEQHLNDYDPTDPQGEVLVFDTIEAKFIEGFAFESAEAQAACAETIGSRKWKVYPPGTGPFGSRRYSGAWRV
ncbi:DarT ssDNA thymidine ADP-ribosyltransferase family protein [Sodalis sp. RH17]